MGDATRLLDAGCGSGQLCALTPERGARVSGIDEAEELAGAAALDPVQSAEVDAGWEAADLPTPVDAIVAGAGFEASTEAIAKAAAPFRRPDGSYRFENKFRYVLARA